MALLTRADSLYSPNEADPSDARLARQMRRLGEVLAETSAPAARAAAERAGLLAGTPTLERLRRIPLLRKEALPAEQAGNPPLGGWAARERMRKLFASPGPIYEPEGPAPDPWGCATAMHAAGIRAGDVVLNSFSYHLTPAGSIMEGGLLALGAVVIPGGTGNTEIQCRAAAHLRATGYAGTPSFLATLLEKADELRVALALEVAFVSAEPLPDSLRHGFVSRGVRTQQAYATADAGIIAYECPLVDGLHVGERCIVELVDSESGAPVGPDDPGEIVITLLDPTYPLLRLATGDLSIYTAGPCRCGRTAPRLRGILGRTGDAVKVRGLFVHPSTLKSAMAGHPEVARYQFVVRRSGHLDEIVARIEREQPDDALARRVQAAVHDATRLRAAVEFVAPGTLGNGTGRVLVDERRWS
ncbi:MAG TPA: AMP-binding protein [bacterium]|nr:AMP-binding protein [bacterium]